MINKQDKQLKELQKKVTKLEIALHEKSFIHISWYSMLRFFAFLGSLGLSILNFMLIISTWKMLNLGGLTEEGITEFHQLLILYPIIGQYILIGLTVLCLTALIKGGFNKLKSYDEEGLIGGLIVGLIVGLDGGLIWGVI